MRQINPKDRLIVALDAPSPSAAKKLALKLSPAVGFFKVGSELFTAGGPETVSSLTSAGFKVFLDLKFFDIPNTMAAAIKSASALKPALINVHALAGPTALALCAETLGKIKNPPKLLAVTVLTSFSGAELKKTGVRYGSDKMVLNLCKMALDAGADGVVASPLETKKLRDKFGGGFLIVTPGVRPEWAAKNDQKRVASPRDAIRDGADYIVVGRPILNAPNPLKAARMIIDEIGEASGL